MITTQRHQALPKTFYKRHFIEHARREVSLVEVDWTVNVRVCGLAGWLLFENRRKEKVSLGRRPFQSV